MEWLLRSLETPVTIGGSRGRRDGLPDKLHIGCEVGAGKGLRTAEGYCSSPYHTAVSPDRQA